MTVSASRFCAHCGATLRPGVKFCEPCGSQVDSGVADVGTRSMPSSMETRDPTLSRYGQPVEVPGIFRKAQDDTRHRPAAVEDAVERDRPVGGRGQRVLLAMGIVTAAAAGIGWWIAGIWETLPPEPATSSGEELFPAKPVGIDSVNNTIDGKPVAIEGDGHIMNSPGLGVNRPVWCLNGPRESEFTVAVGKTSQEGMGTFSPGFQVLVPVLREEAADPKQATIRLSLIGLDGKAEIQEFQLRGENRWQPLAATFAYDSRKAPYSLRFEAAGFVGAIYIDRAATLQ